MYFASIRISVSPSVRFLNFARIDGLQLLIFKYKIDMMSEEKKKSIIDVGKTVPKNLKFGVVVTVAVFWAEFLRTALQNSFKWIFGTGSPVVSDFIVAVAATAIAYLFLLSYRKILPILKKLKV